MTPQAACRVRRRRVRRLVGSRAGSAAGAAPFFAGCWAARRARIVDAENRLADAHFVAGFDLDLLDLARDRRGHFDGRFVGLELEDRLILRQGVAGLDQDAQHVAWSDVFAQFGKCEVDHDQGPLSRRRKIHR